MLSSVDVTSSVAVYVQIENHVQFAISSGKLTAGDQLPSVRELSERLNVNPNTVAKAYRDLEVMGLLYTRRGMGVFVNKGVDVRCREECRKRIFGRLHEVVAEGKAAGMPESELVDFAKKCYALDSDPYSEPPSSLTASSKSKSSSRKRK